MHRPEPGQALHKLGAVKGVLVRKSAPWKDERLQNGGDVLLLVWELQQPRILLRLHPRLHFLVQLFVPRHLAGKRFQDALDALRLLLALCQVIGGGVAGRRLLERPERLALEVHFCHVATLRVMQVHRREAPEGEEQLRSHGRPSRFRSHLAYLQQQLPPGQLDWANLQSDGGVLFLLRRFRSWVLQLAQNWSVDGERHLWFELVFRDEIRKRREQLGVFLDGRKSSFDKGEELHERRMAAVVEIADELELTRIGGVQKLGANLRHHDEEREGDWIGRILLHGCLEARHSALALLLREGYGTKPTVVHGELAERLETRERLNLLVVHRVGLLDSRHLCDHLLEDFEVERLRVLELIGEVLQKRRELYGGILLGELSDKHRKASEPDRDIHPVILELVATAAESLDDHKGENVIAHVSEVFESVDNAWNEVVVNLHLANDELHRNERVGVRHLAQFPAELPHHVFVVGDAIHNVPRVAFGGRLCCGQHSRLAHWRGLVQSAPLGIDAEPHRVRQLLEDSPHFEHRCRVCRNESERRAERSAQRSLEQDPAGRSRPGSWVGRRVARSATKRRAFSDAQVPRESAEDACQPGEEEHVVVEMWADERDEFPDAVVELGCDSCRCRVLTNLLAVSSRERHGRIRRLQPFAQKRAERLCNWGVHGRIDANGGEAQEERPGEFPAPNFEQASHEAEPLIPAKDR
mmetsp:Transcript_3362/g.12052  ORF Transcript_3362/g.12052 Transcript_3362/m.12052 type:complete len:697 (-) Transcript_3362:949-3039(-)